MAELNHLVGDASRPMGKGIKLIAHVCNDLGSWSADFPQRLSKRWPEPEAAYRQWHKTRADPTGGAFELGNVQFVVCPGEVLVANMIAQRNVRPLNGILPIRYDALEQCLRKVANYAAAQRAQVHMPRMDGGPCGATWERVQPIILATLGARGAITHVYNAESSSTLRTRAAA